MFVAQIDFLFSGKADRLYAVCYKQMDYKDTMELYPNDKFMVLYLFKEDKCDNTNLLKKILENPDYNSVYVLPNSKKLQWEKSLQKNNYTPQLIVTKEDKNIEGFFLSTLMESSVEQKVIFKTSASNYTVWLNGNFIAYGEDIIFKKGVNRILVYVSRNYWMDPFFMLNIVSAKTGETSITLIPCL